MNKEEETPIRSATLDDVNGLAELWFNGWQDAHAEILPVELKRLRTLESFRERLSSDLSEVRMAGAPAAPLGFALTKDDELYQLYVSPAARGTGLALRLATDATQRIRARGHQRAWLACAIGNDRAARFYEKAGWIRKGVMTSQLKTTEGIFALDVWRYEIALSKP